MNTKLNAIKTLLKIKLPSPTGEGLGVRLCNSIFPWGGRPTNYMDAASPWHCKSYNQPHCKKSAKVRISCILKKSKPVIFQQKTG
jgi:hypothetical protein